MLNYAFLVDDAGAISSQESRGKALSDILPTSGSSSNQEFLPPPLTTNCVESRAFEKLYKNIFNQGHLQIIHSAYFGPIRTKQDTLNKNPIIKVFVDAMPPREDEKCNVDTYLMKKAYSMYFRLAIPKGKLKQQEEPNLIDDDNNELLDLMNLAEELPAAEGRILELEDDATQDNNDTPEEE
ncbi:hypothetical protein A0J61_11271 [Choanephora cucurbitarum]|uniref:Uncharacterized protein n=1 Tax=Choanephora cucurbitarum TaxID=101091 RepID=A0A1C7MV37_9FUNG|nr:hypothetical protein A0J61_11271 [Choanephora cucurbitarum]